MEVGLGALRSAAIDEWTGSKAWMYQLRGFHQVPKDEWPEFRASMALDLLALNPGYAHADPARRTIDSRELRNQIFTATDGVWELSDMVDIARDELEMFEMTDSQRTWLNAWRAGIDSSGICPCGGERGSR